MWEATELQTPLITSSSFCMGRCTDLTDVFSRLGAMHSRAHHLQGCHGTAQAEDT